jgi:hypothetical protein
VDANELSAALRGDLFATPSFWTYLRRNKTFRRWIIGSDYVLKDASKPWDVMAFTLYPVVDGPHLERLMSRLNSDITKDIKDISSVNVNTSAINLLRSERFYSVAVMLPKDRYKIISTELIRCMLKNSYEMAVDCSTTDILSPSIKSIRDLYNESKRKNFNAALLLNMTYASATASTIACFLTSECDAEQVTWVSDRDAISEAYNKAYASLFTIGHSGCCDFLEIDGSSTSLGLVHDANVKPGQATWFDPLIRIPDYLCGAISSMDIRGNRLGPVRNKYKNILDHAIANNKNLLVCRIDINSIPVLKYPRITSRRVLLSSTPLN